MSKKPLLVILGPTASGKTKLAVALASEFDGEIISADSRQVFRDMDIGTGKDLNEYHLNGAHIPYHLINIKEAGEKYHVNAFKDDFFEVFPEITGRNKLPIMCGGTGMYIHSLLQNHQLTAVPVNEKLRLALQTATKEQLQEKLNVFSQKLRAHADYSSAKRLVRAIEIAEYLTHNTLSSTANIVPEHFIIGLQSSVETRRQRILDRLAVRLKSGLIEEVEGLIAKGVSVEMLAFYGLEYRFVANYLANQMDLPTLQTRLGIAICQFAKRQMTFFRKMEKDGIKINWLNIDQDFHLLKTAAILLVKNEFESK